VEKNPQGEDLLEFPCDHQFKAFGPNEGDFSATVRKAIGSVVSVPLDAVRSRPSSRGSYVCVSVLVRLHSYDQMKRIYSALQDIDELKYLL